MNTAEMNPRVSPWLYPRSELARIALAIAVCGSLAGGSSCKSEAELESGREKIPQAEGSDEPRPSPEVAPPNTKATKVRFLVVSSYHREYLWSQDTNRGFIAAMTEHGYIDDEAQAETFTSDDRVITSRAEICKLWMDTKRQTGQESIAKAVAAVKKVVDEFRPDIILLGDDNAANYIGNQYLDTETPIVFWGINGLPVKYGLLDSLERPGHNVTGVYQAGYLAECLTFLKKITPEIATLAVLSDDSPTGRAKAKALQALSDSGKIPVEVVATVVTNSAAKWKSEAERLAKTSDAFFVLNHNTLQDESGKTVDPLALGAWYLRNIKKPDCGHERQFAVEGMLATADDSGFNQAYEAVGLAHQILAKGAEPGELAVRAPKRGPLILNRARARMLGIEVSEEMGVEEFIDTALALEKYPE